MKYFSLTLTLILLTASSFAQPAPAKSNAENLISTGIAQAPCKDKERLAYVKKLFTDAGAANSDIVVDSDKGPVNVTVTKTGDTAETVVIGAHYDQIGGGCGVIDNWTGVAILSALYNSIKTVKTKKTYVFVAFDEEEKGLLGSRKFVKNIPEEKLTSYCAMVNLDSFGFAYPQVMDNVSQIKMRELAEAVAGELKLKYSHAAIEGASSDSASFNAKKIPAITFHGLDNNWAKYIHTDKDQFKNLNVNSLLVGYQFALNFIAKLEGLGCRDLRLPDKDKDEKKEKDKKKN